VKQLHKIRKNIHKNRISYLIIGLGVVAAGLIVLLPKVEQKTESAAQIVECDGVRADDFACWSERYKALVQQKSVKEAFDDLRQHYPDSVYLQSQCHQITHIIGRTSAESTESVGDIYSKGDSFCWSGYYHGVIEQVAKKMGKDEFLGQLNTICADVEAKSRYSFYHYNCVHGLGHGVMSISDNELFDSLKSCDSITDSWNRSSCIGGVFMENVMSDPATNPTHTTKYLKPEEPLYPCTAVDVPYKEQCYLMQTSYALRQINYDFSKGFSLCAGVDVAFQPTCYQSLGRDASGGSVSDVTRTKANCELGITEQQRTNCAIGAVKDFISYYSDDQKARQLCASFSDEIVRSTCDFTATEYYRSF
jgi:hypothetical protein